ncbi:NAD(P)-dependent oxidoreductase [Actinomadura rupiterrae]|uniref:NAD(P)-dependent oxidoreductase n=1 Tax=Actinomadura rupiterrae TaxID=559627 RepID=UPI0020A5D603|nr:NAD(P)-dependent oxidoreductase [Actinomadura rupiterrae]MCP2339804.1 3-hydroxyisobutyrate dehydrogenase-like beta-hydroxyacid dehydrogenase [Actinomadura rupiterrae]
MGAPMAGRLLAAGHELTVWNRTPERAAPLASRGARTAATPAEAVAGHDLVISMLTDAAAVHDVLLGARIAPGTLVVEMSTIGPDAVRELRERLPAGVALVDAPVLGSVPHAEAGELIIMPGGADADVERAADVLGVFGPVRPVGASGQGAAAKLVVNSALIAAFGAVAEAVQLATSLGLDRDTALELLGRALPQAERTRTRNPDAPVTFTAGLADKDLGLALGLLGPDAGVLAAARAHTAAAVERGLGGADITVLVPSEAADARDH